MFLELDSHADTCCFGQAHCLVLKKHDYVVEVSGFHPDLPPIQNVPVVQCAVAYDDPKTFLTYMLIFNQALLVKDMTRALICPNQLRMNGCSVRDAPKQFNPTPGAHTITQDGIVLPLQLQGIMSVLPIQKPTLQEFNETFYTDQLIMTAASPVWDPYSDTWQAIEQEQRFQNSTQVHQAYHMHSNTTRIMSSVTATMHGMSFACAANEQVRVNEKKMQYLLEPRNACRLRTSPRKGAASPQKLAELWCLPLDLAQETVEATTQKGVWDFTNMTLRMKPIPLWLNGNKNGHPTCTLHCHSVVHLKMTVSPRCFTRTAHGVQ